MTEQNGAAFLLGTREEESRCSALKALQAWNINVRATFTRTRVSLKMVKCFVISNLQFTKPVFSLKLHIFGNLFQGGKVSKCDPARVLVNTEIDHFLELLMLFHTSLLLTVPLCNLTLSRRCTFTTMTTATTRTTFPFLSTIPTCKHNWTIISPEVEGHFYVHASNAHYLWAI